jgi:hypothetical protein
LFNSSLDGNARRAIDIFEGDTLNEKAFKALVRAAAALNTPSPKAAKVKAPKKTVLLSGGNPKVAKADGEAPVQAYIAKMPGWKREVGRKLDALIVRAAPGVRKAVKWNSPLYGIEAMGWFLGVHVFKTYVKVTFFNGAHLKPKPPGGTARSKEARWIDIHEDDEINEAQMTKWVKQAAALPGFLAPRP